MADQSAVLVFASQKGGSGKTTLSGHVAVEAERAGDGPVALIDTDPQGSLAKWWNERSASRPAFARVAISQLGPGIEHLQRNGFRLIVIDTPPAVTESIRQVVAHADLVIAPTRPSPHDLRAVGPTVDIADAYRKALLFVVNSATARARITGETAVALSQHGVVAPVTIHHRTDFAAAMIDGRTAGEVRPDSKSAQEIATLWAYMKGQLARIKGPESGWQPAHDLTASLLSPAQAEDYLDDESGEEDLDPALLVDSILPGLSPAGSGGAPPPIEIPSPFQSGARPSPNANPAANGNWDGIDRRKADAGPPPGMPERRRVFGRRTAGTH